MFVRTRSVSKWTISAPARSTVPSDGEARTEAPGQQVAYPTRARAMAAVFSLRRSGRVVEAIVGGIERSDSRRPGGA
jgi:hypothetical protein